MAVQAQEIYNRVTAQVIAAIESGQAGEWTRPWTTMGGLPKNATTNRAYSGGNVLVLWMIGESAGYRSQLWATYRQWDAIGAKVRKGEKGTHLVKWNVGRCKGTPKDHRCKKCGGMFPVSFAVFNADQVDGYEIPTPLEGLSETERLAHAEEWFSAIGADVRQGGDRAFYAPVADYIGVPTFGQFDKPAHYYSTLAHEHCHWTGHKDRLGRELASRFAQDAYAAEELVAELGAAFICAILGIDNAPRPDHALYLAHWLTILRGDSKALFFAAGQASKAVEYLSEKVEALALSA